MYPPINKRVGNARLKKAITYTIGTIVVVFLLGFVGRMAYEDEVRAEEAAKKFEEILEEARKEERIWKIMEEMRNARKAQ